MSEFKRDCSGDLKELFDIAAADVRASFDLDERIAQAQERQNLVMANADFLEAIGKLAEEEGMGVFDFMRREGITPLSL